MELIQYQKVALLEHYRNHLTTINYEIITTCQKVHYIKILIQSLPAAVYLHIW